MEANKLTTQADAILYFLQRMDIEMINDILDDDRTYQDFKKCIFIHKLGNAFDQFIAAGDTFLHCYRGFCNAEDCSYKCAGFSFIGNHSRNYLDLIIDTKEGIVHNMYECAEFKSLETGFDKKDRIKIHTFEFRR